ncbi:MAG: hypothetical protein HY815_17215 [Candidatus Riflebacteria bacterium]|nr:hypothetical protein [Candidatus Riflebacteria bacterium]
MRPFDLYIETSAWNFLLATDAPDRRLVTERFFRHARECRYRLFVSDLVVVEMGNTKCATRRSQLLDLIRRYRPVLLAITTEMRGLAERYVIQGTVPAKYRDDAIHVAAAVVARLDAVVSWNFAHLVKLKTRREVNALNRLNGYAEIEIVTPEEVA